MIDRTGTPREIMLQVAVGMRRLGKLHWRSLRNLALRTALKTGEGMRGIRAGCYTFRDILELAGLDNPEPVKRANTLRLDIMPTAPNAGAGLTPFETKG